MLLLYKVIVVASKDTFLVRACKGGNEMMIVNKIVHFHSQFVLILRQLQAYINPLDYHEKTIVPEDLICCSSGSRHLPAGKS